MWRDMKTRHEMKGIYKKVYDLLWDGIRRIKPSILSELEDFNTKVLALISRRPPAKPLETLPLHTLPF
jgi:hypothetical protein